MTEIEQLHDEAMDAAERGMFAQRRSDEARAHDAFAEAFEREARAARLAVDQNVPEPSRSILLRSAATLALDCGRRREAERLIAIGLAGDPPDQIADELRDLLEQVHFDRHLDLKGIKLSETDVQMSIAGKAVGYGFANSHEVLSRIFAIEKLTQRSIERLMNQTYREGGAPSKEVRRRSEIYMSTGRAASFAFTIRVGELTEQPMLDFEQSASPSAVLDYISKGLSLINDGLYLDLYRTIDDEAYYRSFVGLARTLYPSGTNVSMVGLTINRDGVQQRMELTHSKNEVRLSLPFSEEEECQEDLTIVGELGSADKYGRKQSRIGIQDDNRYLHTIDVPAGLLSDIVRPLWETRVRAVVRPHGKRLSLVTIDPEESD